MLCPRSDDHKLLGSNGYKHKVCYDIFHSIRSRLSSECQRHSAFAGEVEVDESYFGRKRTRGQRRLGAGSETTVIDVFLRNDCCGLC